MKLYVWSQTGDCTGRRVVIQRVLEELGLEVDLSPHHSGNGVDSKTGYSGSVDGRAEAAGTYDVDQGCPGWRVVRRADGSGEVVVEAARA